MTVKEQIHKKAKKAKALPLPLLSPSKVAGPLEQAEGRHGAGAGGLDGALP